MSIHSKALAQTSSPRKPGSEGLDIPRSGGEEVLRPSLTVGVLVRCQSCSVSSSTTHKDLTSEVGLPKSREGGNLKSSIDHWGKTEKLVPGWDSELPKST